jgi:hypothetical protein
MRGDFIMRPGRRPQAWIKSGPGGVTALVA